VNTYRVHDDLLGGKDNYMVDRDAVAKVLAAVPEVRDMARENRAFVQRVVRYLVGEASIRQIIDIGTGIPTAGNVHEVAQEVHPGVRVAYVDNDRYKPGCAHASRIGQGWSRAVRGVALLLLLEPGRERAPWWPLF
jgi:hypothetical protein